MLSLSKTVQAEEDLYEIWHFIVIEKQNPLNAYAFIFQLDAAFQVIVRTPEIGVLKEEYSKNIRQYIFGNYLIFYLIRIDDIQIVRVLHGKRDIPNLF